MTQTYKESADLFKKSTYALKLSSKDVADLCGVSLYRVRSYKSGATRAPLEVWKTLYEYSLLHGDSILDEHKLSVGMLHVVVNQYYV